LLVSNPKTVLVIEVTDIKANELQYGCLFCPTSGAGVYMHRSRPVVTIVTVVMMVVVLKAPLVAHHGAAAFENDPAKRLTLKGTVVEWFWANPHCFLQFDVRGDDGRTVRWVVETSNPPDMVNRGWSKGSFKPGDIVSVTIRPVKSEKPVGSVVSVVLPSGQVLSAGGDAPASSPGANNSNEETYPAR
jgi:hypothetical protein